MNGSGSTIHKAVSIVKLFRAGAKMPIHKASEAIGRSAYAASIMIHALHDAGLLHVAHWERGDFGNYFRVYAWAEPFGAPDARRPKTTRRAS